MSRPKIFVKYEENTSGFVYGGGGDWSVNVDERWSGRGQTWPAYVTNRDLPLGNMTFTFQGTSVAIVGNTPNIPSSQSVRVSIDGADYYTSPYSDPLPQSYRQWYQSPVLPDGDHIITFVDIDGTSVDYALVTAGESTSLQSDDSLVMVDDNDPDQFQFVGSWTRDSGMFFGSLNGTPFQNATHRTDVVGDQMFFRFAGTSMTIFGIFMGPQLGHFTINYTLDDDSSTQTTYTSSPEVDLASNNQQPNFLLYHSDGLAAGEHTLVLTLTDIVNQTLVIDYATYKPSFTSISDAPVWQPFENPDTAASTTPDSPSPAETNASNSGGRSKTAVGGIVGGVVGGIALIVACFVAWWYFRRRTKSESDSTEGRHAAPIEPFRGQSMAERESDFNNGTKLYQTYTGTPVYSPLATSSQTRLTDIRSNLSSSGVVVPPIAQSTITSSDNTRDPPPSLSERQAELRRQMQELENRIQELNHDATLAIPARSSLMWSPNSGSNEAEILELRRQIEGLRRENAMLSTPPAYEERDHTVRSASPANRLSQPPAGNPYIQAESPLHSSVRALPIPGKQ